MSTQNDVIDDDCKTEEQLFDKFLELAMFDRAAAILVVDALDFAAKHIEEFKQYEAVLEECGWPLTSRLDSIRSVASEALGSS